MRKDLWQAHQLAAEKHDLQYFKTVLEDFMRQKEADAAAKEVAKLAKKVAAQEKASKAKKAAKEKAAAEEAGDVDMPDAPAAVASDEDGASEKSLKRKKPEDGSVSRSLQTH